MSKSKFETLKIEGSTINNDKPKPYFFTPSNTKCYHNTSYLKLSSLSQNIQINDEKIESKKSSLLNTTNNNEVFHYFFEFLLIFFFRLKSQNKKSLQKI